MTRGSPARSACEQMPVEAVRRKQRGDVRRLGAAVLEQRAGPGGVRCAAAPAAMAAKASKPLGSGRQRERGFAAQRCERRVARGDVGRIRGDHVEALRRRPPRTRNPSASRRCCSPRARALPAATASAAADTSVPVTRARGPFAGDRERDRAAAGAEIEHATHRAPAAGAAGPARPESRSRDAAPAPPA